MPKNDKFAVAVREVMAGRNYRDEAGRIGLHYTTLYEMARGHSRSRETVLKFVKGFSLDEEEWLRLAFPNEHAPAQPSELVDDLLEIAEERPQELTYESDLESFDIKGFRGAESLSDHDKEVVNRIIRSLLSEQRRRQGRE